jgi:hypothetical protein
MVPLALCLLVTALVNDGKAGDSGPRASLSPSVTWLGQDGHDLVGPSSRAGGNGVQDIHLALVGLPRDRGIAAASIKGLGGDEWQANGSPSAWRAEIVRAPGSTKADLFIEPNRPETGRAFEILLRYDDGQTASLWLKGGKADPSLRTAGASLSARWVGQDQADYAGPGPAVGPDGFQDVHLLLYRLSSALEVQSVTIEAPGGLAWQYGLNPKGLGNAELVRRRDDRSRADLYFQPANDLVGKGLKLTVAYANGKPDVTSLVAGPTVAQLGMPAVALPAITFMNLPARWLGQDGSDVTGRGDVHVAVEGLPAGSAIVAAELSNIAHGSWLFRGPASAAAFEADPYALPMIVRQEADATGADLYFPPVRDESDTTMTLRLRCADGGTVLTPIAGGRCDVARRAPELPPGEVTAHPGDDLHALVAQVGTVRLSRGTYPLSRPLILQRPIAITAEPGATLLFSQPIDDPPWTAAIKVHCGGTVLDGFSVRFSGSVRWARDVNYGPAVIGTSDNLDSGNHSDPKVNLTLTHLDLEAPPAARPGTWEETPRLLRLVTASSGRVAGNILRGGTVEFLHGSWVIEQNEHRGTPPSTHTFAVFAGHHTHDLILRANRAEPTGPSGKTWRFLVLTGSGTNDLIERNVVSGVGPRDGDTIPNMNAPEIVLTEAYSLHFEGKPAAVSADGRIVKIPAPQGDRPLSGDVVAILTGPEAGRWRRIAHALDASTFVLDRPLPGADAAISVAMGFVGETFRGNTIDSRGGAVAANLVLVGNHYGTRVLGNHFLGGGEAYHITAAPTEQPAIWGWSHAPYLDGLIEGNIIEDALRGGTITVEHTSAIKTSKGRVYMSVTLKNNIVRWSDVFLSRRPRAKASEPLLAWTLGDAGSLDPGELIVHQEGNRLQPAGSNQPVGTMQVRSASMNGQAMRNRTFAVPSEPRSAPGSAVQGLPQSPRPTRVSDSPANR